MHVEAHNSLSICLGWLYTFFVLYFFIFNKTRVWSEHDAQEAEESELQRAGERTRIPGRHLFPLIKVRQLQDCELAHKLFGGLQLQDFGLLWRDAAQKLQKGR